MYKGLGAYGLDRLKTVEISSMHKWSSLPHFLAYELAYSEPKRSSKRSMEMNPCKEKLLNIEKGERSRLKPSDVI